MVVSRAVLFEPKMAVFAENDGLYFYNKMLKQLNDINHRPKYILVECLSQQVSTLTKLLNKLHYKQIRSEGLVHMFLFDSKKIGCQL
jgi:methylase of polypeptide subunit release factors